MEKIGRYIFPQKTMWRKSCHALIYKIIKPISDSLPINYELSSSMNPRDEVERIEMSRVLYALAMGSLMYAMICTRPDITKVVAVVSRFMANIDREHWHGVKRILPYIKETSGVTLCFGGSEFTLLENRSFTKERTAEESCRNCCELTYTMVFNTVVYRCRSASHYCSITTIPSWKLISHIYDGDLKPSLKNGSFTSGSTFPLWMIFGFYNRNFWLLCKVIWSTTIFPVVNISCLLKKLKKWITFFLENCNIYNQLLHH